MGADELLVIGGLRAVARTCVDRVSGSSGGGVVDGPAAIAARWSAS